MRHPPTVGNPIVPIVGKRVGACALLARVLVCVRCVLVWVDVTKGGRMCGKVRVVGPWAGGSHTGASGEPLSLVIPGGIHLVW